MNRKMSTISLAQPHFKHKQSRRYYLWNKPLDGPVQNEILVDGGWSVAGKHVIEAGCEVQYVGRHPQRPKACIRWEGLSSR
jgi:hypothetical protein